jgi:hypothetical protein
MEAMDVIKQLSAATGTIDSKLETVLLRRHE